MYMRPRLDSVSDSIEQDKLGRWASAPSKCGVSSGKNVSFTMSDMCVCVKCHCMPKDHCTWHLAGSL